jgi:hypothetical protein
LTTLFVGGTNSDEIGREGRNVRAELGKRLDVFV